MYENKQNSENGQKKQIPQIQPALPPLPKKNTGETDIPATTPIRAVKKPLPEQVAALPYSPSSVSPMPERVQAGQASRVVSYSHTHNLLLARRRKLWLRHLSRKRLRQDRLSTQRRISRFWLTLASMILSGLFLFLTLSGGGAYIAYSFYQDTQQRFASQVISLRDLLPRDNLKMYDSKGVLIGQLTDQGLHTSVALQDISQHLINATIATEDKNFWTNPGVDVARIAQSALDDLKHGRVVAGGSTITQQLIKTLIVGNRTSLERKLQEVALTPMVNEHYSKSEILEMYLNSIYYGEQAYGIDAAAYIYFGLEDQPGKPAAKQLSLAQSAMLAGIPQAPYAYDPLLHREAALARMQTVLDLMVSNGYIKTFDALEAMKEAQKPDFFKRPATLKNRAPHFFYFTLAQLQQIFHLSREQLSRSDMSVTTTLNLALQDKIQKIMQEHIAALRDTHHVTNAAEVLIDFHSGAILSLLGSIDYYSTAIDGKYDVATQGYRQPGSSFKPYVYVTAFAQGASPAQAVVDSPLSIKIPGGNPPVFTPTNYDGQFHGHMTLRCALQNSLNIPAVKVLQHAGIDASMKTAREMGITSYNGTPGYSLVLGGLGVHLLDHTSAFGTFANGGVHVPYYTVEKVTFATSHRVYTHQSNPGKRVISPQLAYMMTDVLKDNQSRIPQFFDCNVLQLYSNSQAACWNGNRGQVRPAAAKTGTTNDFKDNWTIGYTTDYVMGVWAGNNDGSPMYNVTGVQGAAPIWHDAMLVAEEGRPIRDFQYPGGLERATVTYPDGVHVTDWFLPGTVPVFSPPSATPTPVATATPSAEKQPPARSQPVTLPARPYCPNNYTFASQPPSGNTPPNGWW